MTSVRVRGPFALVTVTVALLLVASMSPGTARVAALTGQGRDAPPPTNQLTRTARRAPTVTGVSLRGGSASGGTRLTVRGTGFTHVTAVTFGAARGSAIHTVSSTSLVLTTPRHAAGAVFVRVVTAYGTSAATTAGRFVYLRGKVVFYDDFRGRTLSPVWAVVQRHGEYAQQETECNVAREVGVDNMLTIGTRAAPTRCGDFDLNGDVRHRAQTWPFATGDVQWRTLQIRYGTVTYRARFPPQDTRTWPAIWLLGGNCQRTNLVTADVGYATCPQVQTAHYSEIDITECYSGNWCQLALSQNGSFPHCDYRAHTDSRWHTFALVWKPGSIEMFQDGRSTGCGYSAAAGYTIPSTPMFLIVQTQTGGVGDVAGRGPTHLPTTLQVSSIAVTEP